MIKINLDEGYVFDILSILEVKIEKASDKNLQKIYSSFWNMKQEIISQIGEKKVNEILSSKEYKNLLLANKLTFNLVDKAKQEKGIAKDIDDSNYQRYTCKINLQKTFFNNEISEIKIGYNNE